MKTLMLNRTKKFALDCWFACAKFPNSREYNAYVSQLIRSSSSVWANYRAVQRAKSSKDFINKLKIVEEVDESKYFLELLSEIENINKNENSQLEVLINEADELIAIVVSSLKTARKNNPKK